MPLPDYLAGRDLDGHDCEPAISGNRKFGVKQASNRQISTVKGLRNSHQRFKRWPFSLTKG